jgi:hypothetical protein
MGLGPDEPGWRRSGKGGCITNVVRTETGRPDHRSPEEDDDQEIGEIRYLQTHIRFFP